MAKYDLKFILVCDVDSEHMLIVEPYVDKGSTPAGIPVAEYYVNKFTEPVYRTNRIITMDNWFTSVPLAIHLVKSPYNLTLLGTLHSKKKRNTTMYGK